MTNKKDVVIASVTQEIASSNLRQKQNAYFILSQKSQTCGTTQTDTDLHTHL